MPGFINRSVTQGSWTDLTGEDIGAITFQVQHGSVEYMATTGAVEPAETTGFLLRDSDGEISSQNLAEIFPHISGSITRIWVRLIQGSTNRTRVAASWS